MKNIGYHTRLHLNNTIKVCGGSFGGTLDIETANRLVNAHFSVTVKNSGRPVFVDREGREVALYISVDPETTDKGKVAMKAHHQAQEERDRLNSIAEEAVICAVDEAIAAFGHDAVMGALGKLKREDLC